MSKLVHRLFLLLLGMVLFQNLSIAQTCPALPNQWVRGAFTSPIIACVGQSIAVVNNTATATNLKYTYDFKTFADTSKATALTTFTFPTIGTYLIVQTGTIGGKRSLACNIVRVVATPKPTFSVSSCGNSTVRLTVNTAGLAYTGYQINWGDGTPNTNFITGQATPIHTYANNNIYRVVVSGLYAGATCNGPSDPQNVTPIGGALTLPTITNVTVIDATIVELTYTGGDPTIKYSLLQRLTGSAVSSVVTNASSSVSGNETKLKITGLNTAANVYFYSLNYSFVCGTSAINLSTTEVPTIALTVTTPNYQNNLQWRNFGNARIKQFIVKRDGTQIAIVPAAQFTYADTKAKCGQKYSYQVIAETNTTPAATSVSLVREATTQPVATPPALANVLVNVRDDRTAIVSVSNPPTGVRVSYYTFSRSDGTIVSQDSAKFISSKSSYVDTTANPGNQSVCYKISYTDVCDRTAPASVTVCSVHLVNKGEELRWTPELPFSGTLARYDVERLDAQGRVKYIYNNIGKKIEWPMDEKDPDQDVIYRIRAYPTSRLVTNVVSNKIYYFRNQKIFVPDAFTPNGDFVNETFEIKGLFIKDAQLTIFARTGQTVFYTTDWKKGWDGKNSDGIDLPSGTYTYLIEATDLKGNTSRQAGTVQILR
jgi:gliding motility-associated-like protein